MEKNDKILLASLQDKINKSIEYNMATNTSFLDIRQCSMVETYCNQIKDISYDMYGGYEEAERRLCIILPSYQVEYEMISLIRVIKKGPKELTHRDYLGSILGLGIKREQIGDIIVSDFGCDAFVMNESSKFIINELKKVGNTYVETKEIDPSELAPISQNIQELILTVSSMRLDNIVASIYRISRSKAKESIEKGLIFVNGQQCQKVEKLVKEGDVIVFRGRGKNILDSTMGNTAKDKRIVLIKKYL